MLKIGGNAQNNGIVFIAKKYQVNATIGKDGSIKVMSKKIRESKIKSKTCNIPFIRGLVSCLPIKWYLPFIVIYFLIELLNIFTNNTNGLIEIEAKFLFVPIITVVSIVIYLLYSKIFRLNWLRFHSAEHRAIHTYEKGKEITLDALKNESNLHTSCGTVYAIILFPLLVLSYLLTQHLLISYLLASSVTNEIFRIEKPMEKPFIKYIFKVTLYVQRLVTQDPTEKELLVAIRGIKELIQLENQSFEMIQT